jgi:hypothetical protein
MDCTDFADWGCPWKIKREERDGREGGEVRASSSRRAGLLRGLLFIEFQRRELGDDFLGFEGEGDDLARFGFVGGKSGAVNFS